VNPTTIPIESVAYLERLVRCNEAVGDCLATPIRTAAGFETASRNLGDPSAWPEDAARIAREHRHAPEFTWLPPLFSEPHPGGRCPVWEQAAEDLFACETYRDFVYQRTKTYLSTAASTVGGDPRQSPRDRAVQEFAYVLWALHRQVIGWAVEMLRRQQAGEIRTGWTWLRATLFRAGDIVGQEVREVLTGVRRRPDKPKPAGPAGSPGPVRAARPRVVFLTDLEREGHALPSVDLLSPEVSPDDNAASAERDGLLRARIEALPEPERAVIRLTFFEERTLKETADALNYSVERVRKLRARALLRLRGEVPDDGAD
jgi:RNA polymerase sigma factor (sigma-70 family)